MLWRAPLQSVRPDRKFRSRGRKLLLTIAILGATASIAGLGTFATFTSSTSASHTVASGTVTIGLGVTGAAATRLNVDATAITPVHTIQWIVDLIDKGTLKVAPAKLTATATTSSA